MTRSAGPRGRRSGVCRVSSACSGETGEATDMSWPPTMTRRWRPSSRRTSRCADEQRDSAAQAPDRRGVPRGVLLQCRLERPPEYLRRPGAPNRVGLEQAARSSRFRCAVPPLRRAPTPPGPAFARWGKGSVARAVVRSRATKTRVSKPSQYGQHQPFTAPATRLQDALHRHSKVKQDPPQVVDDLILRAVHRGERLPGGGHALGPPWVVPEVADAGGQRGRVANRDK